MVAMTHRSDAYERLEVQRIEIEQLRPIANAAMALRDKLKAIHVDAAYQSVWTVNQLHAGPYRGPTYTDELAALDAALDAIPSAKGSYRTEGTGPMPPSYGPIKPWG